MENEKELPIFLSLEKGTASRAVTQLETASVSYTEVVAKRLGGEEIASLLVTLSASTLPIIAGIIIAEIRARRYIELKVKGLTVRGMSEDSVERILAKFVNAKED